MVSSDLNAMGRDGLVLIVVDGDAWFRPNLKSMGRGGLSVAHNDGSCGPILNAMGRGGLVLLVVDDDMWFSPNLKSMGRRKRADTKKAESREQRAERCNGKDAQ